MVIIPGMDIMNSKVTTAENVPWVPDFPVNHDPIEIAAYWKEQGAGRLYVSDMEGARFGEPITLNIIKRIVDEVGIKIFLGGGIRSTDTAKRAFDVGVEKIVIGTSIAFEPDFGKEMLAKYRENIIVSLGNLNGYVAVQDWSVRLDETIFEFAQKVQDWGAKYIVYNDIARKGAHGGPNLFMIKKMLEAIPDLTLMVGCGISSLGDIERLRDLKIVACIMVTALYQNMVSYKDAVEMGKVKK